MRSLVRLLPKARTRMAGEITLKGQSLYALSEGEVQNLRGSLVAMVFQEPMTALDPVYTVGEQIIETLMRHQQMSREQARQCALQYRRGVSSTFASLHAGVICLSTRDES
jgi:peptide/nickel transport system ATP-binding protein